MGKGRGESLLDVAGLFDTNALRTDRLDDFPAAATRPLLSAAMRSSPTTSLPSAVLTTIALRKKLNRFGIEKMMRLSLTIAKLSSQRALRQPSQRTSSARSLLI
jgi:hypothetical protein